MFRTSTVIVVLAVCGVLGGTSHAQGVGMSTVDNTHHTGMRERLVRPGVTTLSAAKSYLEGVTVAREAAWSDVHWTASGEHYLVGCYHAGADDVAVNPECTRDACLEAVGFAVQHGFRVVSGNEASLAYAPVAPDLGGGRLRKWTALSAPQFTSRYSRRMLWLTSP